MLAPFAFDTIKPVPQVLVVVLGQEFPDAAAGAAEQLFSLAVAGVGLAAFALVLALTEQVVLEVLEDNVKRGSKVYEREHVSVLCQGPLASTTQLTANNDGLASCILSQASSWLAH